MLVGQAVSMMLESSQTPPFMIKAIMAHFSPGYECLIIMTIILLITDVSLIICSSFFARISL